MATDTKNRYSDKDLEEFRVLIQDKIDKAEHDLELIKSAYMNDHNNGTDDTSPTFKAFEEGSETMSKEANSALAIRQEKFIRDLKKIQCWVFLAFLDLSSPRDAFSTHHFLEQSHIGKPRYEGVTFYESA